MSTYAAIQKLLKQYPDSKSAVLPALRETDPTGGESNRRTGSENREGGPTDE